MLSSPCLNYVRLDHHICYSFSSFYSCSFLCVCWWCGMGYGSEKVCCGSVYSIWGADNTDPTVSKKRTMQRILIPGNCVLSSHHSTEWVSTELSLLRNLGFGPVGLWPHFHQLIKYIRLFHVCFCLKTSYLLYIADSLAFNSLPTAL